MQSIHLPRLRMLSPIDFLKLACGSRGEISKQNTSTLPSSLPTCKQMFPFRIGPNKTEKLRPPFHPLSSRLRTTMSFSPSFVKSATATFETDPAFVRFGTSQLFDFEKGFSNYRSLTASSHPSVNVSLLTIICPIKPFSVP